MPNKTIESAPKTLPEAAKRIWIGAFNGAWDGTCAEEGDRREECAAKVGWAAVKGKYERKGKTWVKKSSTQMDLEGLTLHDLEATYLADFIVTKTSSAEGELRWMGRASDTMEDNLGTRMTKTLFMNFIRRAEFFGQPYLGVAHYGALEGRGIAGDTQSMWIDGSMFKARGLFNGNSLGLALYGALNTERSAQDLDPDQRIRLSLGFLDLKHTHGNFTFTRESFYEECPLCNQDVLPDLFLDGVLIHFAATRVPINTRTSLELEETAAIMRSDAMITTRKSDAQSIVGEALATELEALSEAGSLDPDTELSKTAVTLSDSQSEVEEATPQVIEEEDTMSEQTQQTPAIPLEGEQEEQEDREEQEVQDAEPTETPEDQETPETPEPSLVTQSLVGASNVAETAQVALTAFSQGVVEVLQTTGLSQQERLEKLQPLLNTMSTTLVESAEIASADPQTQLVTAFRSALREELGPVVQSLQNLVLGVGLGGQQQSGRRSHSAVGLGQQTVRDPQAQTDEKPSQFQRIARSSVGLDQEPTQ